MDKKFNSHLCQIVTILSDGEFHDGTTMGDALQMTRSAVWKTIKKLIAYDIPITSIKGKGYTMTVPLILLDPQKIKMELDNKKLPITLFESIGSTNDYLKLKKKAKGPEICLAEQQTQGKGRLARKWHSPFGQNIYLSCLYLFQKDISELAGLSLVVGLAVINVLKSYGVSDQLFVKWPNDILFGQKKLAGNLIEIQAESYGESQAIIGIGLNVNMRNEELKEINQAWVALSHILNCYVDRNELSARLINRLFQYLHHFNEFGFAPFHEEWLKADSLTGETITIKNVRESLSGRVVDINAQGHLVLRLANGILRSFSSGDATILKKS